MESKQIVILYMTVFFACLISDASGAIHEYVNVTFAPLSDAYFFLGGCEGVYASSDALPNEGGSFIRFESVVFVRPMESARKQNGMENETGLIETIIYEVNDTDRIGGAFLNSTAICCTPQLSHSGFCKLGEIIIDSQSDQSGWPMRILTFFQGQSLEAKLDNLSVEINSTGLYYLYFMTCDPQLKDTIISGRTIWRNPQGYLPGKLVPLLKLFFISLLAYLVLGLIWLVGLYIFWKDITRIQYLITVVIALEICEMGLWYADYSYLSATGSRSVGITFLAATFTATKKTFSRLLLLAVSMGYGIVRPTFDRAASKITILGVIFFLTTETHQLIQHVTNINNFYALNLLFLEFPLIFLDIRFIVLILLALSNIFQDREVPKNSTKSDLYVKICSSFLMYVLFSVALLAPQLYLEAVDQPIWQSAWVSPCNWTVLEFLFLVVICIIFAPSRNPTRYSYLQEITSGELNEAINLQVAGGE